MPAYDEIRAALLGKVEAAQKHRDDPPENESCTCLWVIVPLLEAVGYELRDIMPQAGAPGGGYPDYTILPDTPHTWYLEAKEWKRTLDNAQDPVQALNYANARGGRWVVLSNGREWLLFDNHIQGVPPVQRVVARANIDSPDFCEFMLALSKPSIQTGGLDRYAAMSRLSATLEQELADKDGPLVKAVCNLLRKKFGLFSLQASDVVAYFRQTQAARTPLPDSGPGMPEPRQEPVPQAGDAISLEELRALGRKVRGNKPEALTLPNGSRVSVDKWVGMAFEVVKWLAVRGKLPPLPFRPAKASPSGWEVGRRRWLLSTSPVHENGTEMRAREIDAGGQPVYLNVDYSSSDFVWCLCFLCEAVGESPSGFAVKLMKPVG